MSSITRPAFSRAFYKSILSRRLVISLMLVLGVAVGGSWWASAAAGSYGVWDDTALPANASSSDSRSIELGVKFQSATAGNVSGVRFYKGAGNTGQHTGSLWNLQGQRLATVIFSNETASGWQTASLAAPVAIDANTTYVVSYHAPRGHYANDPLYFKQSAHTNQALTALKAGTSGANGVYRYANRTAFPKTGNNATNYWVDVVFTPNTDPTPPPDPTPTPAPAPSPQPAPAPAPSPSPTPPPTVGSLPTAPPAQICGTSLLNNGPSAAPAGAVVVPAGDNSSMEFTFRNPNTTFWFAPGTHTLGNGEYDQISPGDNSTFIGAPGAVIDGRGLNRYAFTGQASGVTIQYLTIRGFNSPQDEGVVNHDSGHGWRFQYLTITQNHGAGVFLGQDNTITDSCMKDNGQYGFQGFGQGGDSNITIDHNEIAGNNTDDLETKNPGCGCTGGGKFWDVRSVKVTNNYVHDNHSVGLWADTNDADFLIAGNWIENNDAEAIFYEISYNATISYNVIKHNDVVNGIHDFAALGDNFPTAAIYISESGGDSRVVSSVTGSPTVTIDHNLLVDNYGGVTVWENADRYCNSPNNTSSGYCTLVNPNVKPANCVSGTISAQPYYSDCRWKSQNVQVSNNDFRFNPANVGNCNTAYCGHMALLSNYGTSPSWSPYMGTVIQQAITFSQNNHWSNNTYSGPWQFMPYDTSRLMGLSQWQTAPYGQDAGSTLN